MMTSLTNFHVPYFNFRSLVILMLWTLLFFLTPTHPFGNETSGGIDEISRTQVQRIYETSRIYSILMSYWADLSENTGRSIATTILTESQRHSLDPMLILAMIHVESRFSPNAVSENGARGLMQIRPSVAAGLAQEAKIKNWEGEKSLVDPILNIKLGIFYLGQLKNNFNDLKLALTAYNLGPASLRQRLNDGEDLPFTYAKKVLSIHHAYRKRNSQAHRALLFNWGKARHNPPSRFLINIL